MTQDSLCSEIGSLLQQDFHLPDKPDFSWRTHTLKFTPSYVRNLISPDVHIKGDRFWGMGKTNTEDKVSEIVTFLIEPFKQNKEKTIEKLDELFARISIKLPKDSLDQIYNCAVSEQKDAAEAKRMVPSLR